MIYLPVSIGEAIDKLTILDIKCEKIKDEQKKKHCLEEYNIIYEKLKDHIINEEFLYKKLRDINLAIWELQDIIRDMDNPSGKLCIDILNMNDSRFRIKDIINRKCKSYILEQKGYKPRRALFLGHTGVGDIINLIGAIRYISLQYDETYIGINNGSQNEATIKSFFSDNPNIKILYTGPWHRYHNPSDYTRIFRCGLHKDVNQSFLDIPDLFYDNLEFDRNVRKSYFYVPESQESSQLYQKIKDIPYIFIQQISSEESISVIDWNTDDILTIDPNQNVYSPTHKFYNLADQFVNKKIIDYIDTVKNASEIHTIDSAFYCLAINLPLKANIKKCYDRKTGELHDYYTSLFN